MFVGKSMNPAPGHRPPNCGDIQAMRLLQDKNGKICIV